MMKSREHSAGEDTSFCRDSTRPRLSVPWYFCSSSCHSGRAYGRSYSGASSAMVPAGASTTTSPWWRMTRWLPSVTSPISAQVTSQCSQISRNFATFSGATTAHMRSWDSEARISAAVIFCARSGTLSRLTSMPPSPEAASSEVAQARPAPPKS